MAKKAASRFRLRDKLIFVSLEKCSLKNKLIGKCQPSLLPKTSLRTDGWAISSKSRLSKFPISNLWTFYSPWKAPRCCDQQSKCLSFCCHSCISMFGHSRQYGRTIVRGIVLESGMWDPTLEEQQ